jgi:hypothetical protein
MVDNTASTSRHGSTRDIKIRHANAAGLLRRPAVADNAAMEVDPPKAEPPKRKRRCFQFSLRSLLIFIAAVALACSWIGHQLDWIRQRTRALESGSVTVGLAGTNRCPEPPWSLRILGERKRYVHHLRLPASASDEDLRVMRELFPELDVRRAGAPEEQHPNKKPSEVNRHPAVIVQSLPAHFPATARAAASFGE